MILFRTTHDKIIAAYERASQAERDSHSAVVTALEARISDLRALVFIAAPSRAEELPVRSANAVLDGHEVMPDENEALEAEMREANRILSGNYDNGEDIWEIDRE